MDEELRTSFPLFESITLRVFCEADAASVLDAVERNREHLKPFMHWITDDYSLDAARSFVEDSIAARKERTSCGFGIFKNDVMIGSIGFVNFDWRSRRAELGYWIDKNEEGKGIIAQACKILIDHAFNELELIRIEIRCSSENLRSAAVPERLGFRLEGSLRRSEVRNGKHHDFRIYGLLADDPRLW